MGATKPKRGRPPLPLEGQRQRLLDAARRLLERKELETAGVRDIVAEAGMSSRAFYQVFASRDELILELAREMSEFFLERLAAVPDPAPEEDAAPLAPEPATADQAEDEPTPPPRIEPTPPPANLTVIEHGVGTDVVRHRLVGAADRFVHRLPGLRPDENQVRKLKSHPGAPREPKHVVDCLQIVSAAERDHRVGSRER